MKLQSTWRDCIITYIDLANTTSTPNPMRKMRQLHALVAKVIPDLPSVTHAYTWNDCVLLLSVLEPPVVTYITSMHAADTLKKKIDAVQDSFAIAVKGQCLPHPAEPSNPNNVTFLRASSWAMANCFRIESEAKKQGWKDKWYVDARIVRRLVGTQKAPREQIALLGQRGRTTNRFVHRFDKSLWTN